MLDTEAAIARHLKLALSAVILLGGTATAWSLWATWAAGRFASASSRPTSRPRNVTTTSTRTGRSTFLAQRTAPWVSACFHGAVTDFESYADTGTISTFPFGI